MKYEFEPVRQKTYLSEYIKETLDRFMIVKPVSRIIARCFSGHSVAMVARKKRR